MATRIQLRRGTAEEWTNADPVLAAAEEGHETDTDKRKVGNGVSAWSELPYFGGNGGSGGTSDHGELTGLSDDDHAQYALSDGSRGDFQPPGDYATNTALSDGLAGKADLANGLIQTSQLPALAITSTHQVADEAAMLALTAEEGDLAIRADLSKTFVLLEEPALEIANWIELPQPVGGVQSVNGQTGVVNLGASDVGAAPLLHKSRHATGAADAIAPGDIGAAEDDHGHANATTTTAGFESAADKVKLDAAGFPRVAFVAPSFSNTDHTYTSTGWQSTPLGLSIPCTALGQPPAGYVWKLDIVGGVRMFPPSNITVGTPVFLSISLTGAATTGVDGGGYLPTPQAALPVSAYRLDPPTLTEGFTIRLFLWIGQATGTYRVAPGPYPACIAHLERV